MLDTGSGLFSCTSIAQQSWPGGGGAHQVIRTLHVRSPRFSLQRLTSAAFAQRVLAHTRFVARPGRAACACLLTTCNCLRLVLARAMQLQGRQPAHAHGKVVTAHVKLWTPTVASRSASPAAALLTQCGWCRVCRLQCVSETRLAKGLFRSCEVTLRNILSRANTSSCTCS